MFAYWNRCRMLILLAALGCASGAQEPPEGFVQAITTCQHHAWERCAGIWSCEANVRRRCLSELGWRRVGGRWLRGKDFQRGDEIDAALKTRGG